VGGGGFHGLALPNANIMPPVDRRAAESGENPTRPPLDDVELVKIS
jgi:hypothetical protein